ncbi:hypothetical protein, partial [Mesorhizobium sp. M4B.F.Ca.ET.089.01.1.1]|uniref:hypothetical protein n=2 Tax=Mesorhizobium TaxID=68287 RepID=UPI001AED0CAB
RLLSSASGRRLQMMANLREVLDLLWRWNREPVPEPPSPVDAIVRILRETNKAEKVNDPRQSSRD